MNVHMSACKYFFVSQCVLSLYVITSLSFRQPGHTLFTDQVIRTRTEVTFNFITK